MSKLLRCSKLFSIGGGTTILKGVWTCMSHHRGWALLAFHLSGARDTRHLLFALRSRIIFPPYMPIAFCQESLGSVILFIMQCRAGGQSDCRAKRCLRKKKWCGRDEGRGEWLVASV